MNESIFMIEFQNYTFGNESVPYNDSRGIEGQFALYVTCVAITFSSTLLGMIANIFVLVILPKKGNHRTVFDLTFASLSATDLLACTFAFTYGVHSLVIYLIQYKSDRHVIRRKGGFFFTLSLFNVLLITFLRFFAIFWPIKYRQDMTKAKIKKLVATIWIFSLAVLPAVLYTFKKRKLGPTLAITIFSLGAVVTSTYTMIAIKIFQSLKRKQFD